MLKMTILAASVALCLHALPAHAAMPADVPATDAGSDAVAGDSNTLDRISVIGTGQTRQVQMVGKAELEREIAGASPLKAVSKLPGVNYQSSDPWGNYEWGGKLNIRGFAQQQLGFTLDGVPLGDMSYGNHNGLHISRAIVSENLGAAELSQGSGAIDTASSGNLGGTLRFFSQNPDDAFGVRLNQTIGSNAMRRTYMRIDTGRQGLFAGYMSAVFQNAEKWKGYGPQRQMQVNGKFDLIGDNWDVRGYFDSSRRRETDYADLSLASAKRLGMNWDNYASDWQRAVDAANGTYHGKVTSLDDAYYIARGVRDDDLAYLAGSFRANDMLRFDATLYYHRNEGQGHWATPYAPSSATVPISMRTTEYDIERTGFMPSVTWEFGEHRLKAGLWWEKNVHGVQRNFYALDGVTPPHSLDFLRNPSVRVFRQRFDTDTLQYFVTDHMEFVDGRLAIDAGFKGMRVTTDGKSLIGSRAGGEIKARDSFMPQLAARWSLNDHEEIFGSYSENMAAYRTGVNGPHSASQSAFDTFKDTLRPETSRTLEAGLRSSREMFDASIAVYRVDFKNRLLAIARCVGIAGCPTGFANVGDVRTTGAELVFQLKPINGVAWYNSLAFNNSKYASNYMDGSNLIPTDGKQVVDSPKRLFVTELSYSFGGLSANIGAKYTDRRYLSYLNDSSVDAFWMTDAGIGYQWDNLGWGKSFKLKFDVTNLFDKEYFAGIGTNGFVVSDPQGQNYTLHAGAPRQFFLSAELKF